MKNRRQDSTSTEQQTEIIHRNTINGKIERDKEIAEEKKAVNFNTNIEL